MRKVKRGNKTYLYKYKSQRVNGKVKSIYIGKELQKASSKKAKIKVNRLKSSKKVSAKIKRDIPEQLMKFNNIVNNINDSLISQDIFKATKHYKELLLLYDKLVKQMDSDDKINLYNKVRQIYDSIVANAENIGYTIKE